MARMLWTRRNMMLFEDYFVAPSILMQKAKQACTEFQQMQHKQCTSRSHGNLDQIDNALWLPPELDWIKINWDIATKEIGQRIGVGIAVRDSEGDLLVSCMQPLSFCTQATMAEARGLISAMKLCKELGLQKVVFEGDSLQFVNAVRHHLQENGLLQCLVQDVYSIMANTRWEIRHVRRKANQVAH
ncbi:uncharacterized protein LOC121247259 [Juglans microcarpa x Juglans regia]|uniref:uncharacterized protein LOC121247259 n=1 Tax=Juglans microcarpa x Juglans regia TaxID=2249226 RepID=UPI001B7F7580|nr:uncharacterized protein LOC121247259 [Juglans microcarpa x Juglans regia]